MNWIHSLFNLHHEVFFATCLLQLELKYAEETALLNPPHTGVPWVVVNDQPLKEVCL